MPEHIMVFRRDLFKGTENFIVEQAQAHGCAVTYVGQAVYGEPPDGARWITGWRASTIVRRLRSVVDAVGSAVDIVHAHFGVDVRPASAVARQLGVPLVVTLHGFDVTRTRFSCVVSGRPNLVTYGLGRPRLLRRPQLCLAVSSFIVDKAIECGADPDHVRLHHIGAPSAVAASNRQGIRSGARSSSIVHVARLVEKKGTSYLVEACRLLKERHMSVLLAVVGDGPLKKDLERLAANMGLGDVVKFHGALRHEATLDVIGRADVLTLPSVQARNGDGEGLGMVLLEAAALGVPVVASAVGGITDFVIDGVTGYLVEPRDGAGLADAIERCLINRVEAEEIASRAAASRAVNFDVQVQTRRLEDIFDCEIRQFRHSKPKVGPHAWQQLRRHLYR